MLRKRAMFAMFLSLSFFLGGCFMPEVIVESEQTAQSLTREGMLSAKTLAFGEHSLHYMFRGSNTQALVVFIHGTPGDWKIFSPQLESSRLQGIANLVALDRPGWGASSTEAYQELVSLSEQVAILGPALAALKQKYQSDNLVIVGHSLGGSLVAKLAMDFPDLADAVVVLAGDLTDDYPATRWYNEVASWRAVSWMLPDTMLQANREVIALAKELNAMKNDWERITAPLLVVQGEKDSLVDPRNAEFARGVETSGVIKVISKPSFNHLFHLNHAEETNALIEKVIQRQGNNFFSESG